MSATSTPDEYAPSHDDPLVEEHAAISAWVKEVTDSLGPQQYYLDVDLKSLATGRTLLEGNAEQSLRYVMAAVKQVRFCDRLAVEIRNTASSEIERMNAHHLSGWTAVWGRRRQTSAVIDALLRRALPFHKEDLLNILEWCNSNVGSSYSLFPFGAITRAIERFAAKTPIDDELRQGLRIFASQLRASHHKDDKRYGTAIEQLCGGEPLPEADALPEDGERPCQATPTPAPAGRSSVLRLLKTRLRIKPPGDDPATVEVDPDRFAMSADTPFRAEHDLLSAFFDEVVGTRHYYHPPLAGFPAGLLLLEQGPEETGRLLLAAAERHAHALGGPSPGLNDTRHSQSRYAAYAVVRTLMPAEFTVDRDGLFDILLYLSVCPAPMQTEMSAKIQKLIEQAESEAERSPLTEGERYVLWLFRASQVAGPALGAPSAAVVRLSQLIKDGANFYLTPGEVWSDAVNADLAAMPRAQVLEWIALFKHLLTANASRPSAKWLATGSKRLDAIGKEDARQAFLRWLPLVAKGQSIAKLVQYVGDTRGSGDVINEENADALRGLLWLVQTLPRPESLARAITQVALSAYKKVPGIGPRAVKVGNTAVYALSEIKSAEAVGQLAMLKVRVKFGTAQKEIEKAFNTAAEALGLPRDQIEEMGVPSYGLEEVGRRIEMFGDYKGELTVNGSNAEIQWFDAKGKALKSVPAKVKSEHKDDLKELQESLKDIQSMLPAQRDRLDGMFLLQKSWPYDEWRDRYLQHPLVGTIARRLIWRVDGVPVLFHDDALTDVDGTTVTPLDSSKVTLWHPVECKVDEITAWRSRLETLQITQPFKQAHREIYLLTDAERNTNTYSNRFASHVLRQHQFNALCAARGWKNKLRLMVDDSYLPAMKELPEWGLRVEYWIEGIGDDYGEDTNESGVYLRLSTDQVRFYRIGAAVRYAHATGGGYETSAFGPGTENLNEPLPLEQVPPLVLSEMLRDVDLFVGVASVGNDPTWQDGGPGGRYRDYWQTYSFGELSGTASTRKQVLERLIPRLKIAGRCTFADRFLVVRGDLRTYKIHLGSGNILMEPNDQYLCIVADSRSKAKQEEIFLPFEGDNTLSIILSKAFLLAADKKITDPTITRQIEHR